jgi:hypothetical protein
MFSKNKNFFPGFESPFRPGRLMQNASIAIILQNKKTA